MIATGVLVGLVFGIAIGVGVMVMVVEGRDAELYRIDSERRAALRDLREMRREAQRRLWAVVFARREER